MDVGGTRHPSANGQRFPFDVEFQKALLRLMTEDESFGINAAEHLKPEHFDHEILSWMYSHIKRHVESYNTPPSVAVLMQAARGLDANIQPIYTAMVDQVRQVSLRDQTWLRDQVLDFVKRNIFVRAFNEGRDLYNAGDVDKSYDLVMARMEEITRTSWEPIERAWFFRELNQRQAERKARLLRGDVVPTGFGFIDNIMRGGLHYGELGIWLSYPKIGKTTTLVTLGINAVRRNFKVLHIILEGSLKLIEDRYESAFLNEIYADVKLGDMSVEKYQMAVKEYQMLQDSLVLRSWVEKWDINALDIDAELRELERDHGWRPDLIVIDYVDLMTGREKRYYKNETESQHAAVRDVKRLTNRGYAIWTATQAQRPTQKDLETEGILMSTNVSYAYEKVRACDFGGSLNQTLLEKEHKVMRMHAEMYRDNEAGQTITVGCDMERMQIWQDPAAIPLSATSSPTPALGYEQKSAFS